MFSDILCVQTNSSGFFIPEFNKDLMMTKKATKNKNFDILITSAFLLVVTIAFVLTNCSSQSNIRLNTQTIINLVPKQVSHPANATGINQTDSLNVTNSYLNSSAPLNSDSIPSTILNSTTYNQPDPAQFSSPLHAYTNSYPFVLLTTVPTSLDASKFTTYTYCGYPVQQPDLTQFIFSFPDNTSQSQIAGSDALTLNTYAIQKLDFDATFIAPKISALGFDEMAIFATSDTNNYKGTEFGIRIDLKDGCIYGYVQEPIGSYGNVDFNMVELTTNDGVLHHYTLIMSGSEVSFCIDGVDHGNLNFPSNTDYSGINFSILAVVHRFTDNWDSVGDNMIAGNFNINQQ
jgi:hypothetical protein